MKGATDNQIAKTLGADKFAEGQIVKAVGMPLGKARALRSVTPRNLYKQRDEITEQAKKMHKGLKFTEEVQFGYKEWRGG